MKAKPKKKSRIGIVDPRNAIYDFKIYLLNISPMIYIHFKVKGYTHIAQLHHLIQIIMGWDKTICTASKFGVHQKVCGNQIYVFKESI
ncbi:MAG: hypothetical protein V4585_20665 [Bacteroidota bacterium]